MKTSMSKRGVYYLVSLDDYLQLSTDTIFWWHPHSPCSPARGSTESGEASLAPNRDRSLLQTRHFLDLHQTRPISHMPIDLAP